MRDKYYFASDGSYGLLDERSVIAYTDDWTIGDWLEIENCSDSERAFIARGLFSKYQKQSLEKLRELSEYGECGND